MFESIKKLFIKETVAQKTPEQSESTVLIEALLTPQPEVKKPSKPRKPRKKPEVKQLSPKELASQNDEPYINVISMEVNPDDPHLGAFTFDYNDKFIINLVKSGYKLKPTDTDQMLVDRWFQTVCRNIALEMYEQEQADPDKRALENLRIIRSRNIGDGRSEIS